MNIQKKGLQNQLCNWWGIISRNKQYIVFLLIIFILSLGLRIWNISQNNILFDYDQYEDLFHTRKIILGDLPFIGRPIYGNPDLHHGVIYFYFNLFPFLLFDWSVKAILIWNIFFQSFLVFVIFFLAKSLYKSSTAGYISAVLVATSYQIIQFSAWISSAAITLLTVPIFYLGLWFYFKKKEWGLILSSLFLGLSIQADLLFLYLFPVLAFYWIAFLKLKIPKLKTLTISFLAFFVSIATIIFTELKLNFAGFKALANFSKSFDDGYIPFGDRLKYYFSDLFLSLSYNFSPAFKDFGELLFIVIILTAGIAIYKKPTREGILFTLLYFFSPIPMLFLGYHRQPWFLIGMLPAIPLVLGFILSQIRSKVIIFIILLFLTVGGIITVNKSRDSGPILFSHEKPSLLSSQLAVIDYTYKESNLENFSINAVTYPLYHNALWEYNYYWYGKKKYKFLPTWLGGDQLKLYKTLDKSQGNEKYTYMIIDTTYRIPNKYQEEGRKWGVEQGKVLEETLIGGFTVQKIKNYD